MNEAQTIKIVGGGLAGLTLGIALRREGIPVTLCEKGSYPRHRVCGEFISGQGQTVLEKLGLVEEIRRQGAVEASTVKFVFPGGSTKTLAINPPALCLSRFKLDACLAEVLRGLHGVVLEKHPVSDSTSAEGIVRASGRSMQATVHGVHWFGLKAHAVNLRLEADLEMHCFRHGYVGLTRIEDRKVNVCGLFRRRPGERAFPSTELLLGPANSPLRQKLHRATFQPESFCAVAGLPIGYQRPSGQSECCLGDALTMIPPVTGNGMSMALESADIAIPAICNYSRGEATWQETRNRVATLCEQVFSRRLSWGYRLQRFLFQSWIQKLAGPYLLNSPWLWRMMFTATR